MSKMSKWREYLLKVLKSPSFYTYTCFIIVNLAFSYQILHRNGIGVKGFFLVALLELIVELGVIFVIEKMRKNKKPLEKQFLLVAIVLGILFLVIMPPGQAPDEIAHFRRAYGISEGLFIPDEVVNYTGAIGSDIPVNSEFLLRRTDHGSYNIIAEQIGWSAEEVSKQPYTSAAIYNFICYIPQTLAVLIGKLLGFSVLGMAYLMSVFNFVTWVTLTYFAIKKIPKFKSVVMFISLLPITLQEATSLSPDAMTIGVSVLLVSYILYLAYGTRKKMKTQDFAILSLLALVIGFCKIVYLPLIALILVIPWQRYGSKKKKWIYIGALFFVVAAVNLLWLMVSSRYLIEYRPGVDSGEQLSGILKDPLDYLLVILRTTTVYGYNWMSNMLGVTLGPHSALPRVVFIASAAIMLVLLVQRQDSLNVKKWDRVLFATIFLAIVGLIFTSLYMQWTAYDSEIVEGIQGRYFLPILLLVPVIICRTSNKSPHMELINNRFVLYYGLFVNVITIVTIFANNY